jgi:serine/threonine protein kinase
LPVEISSKANDLLTKLLSQDPTERPTAAEILDFPWLSKYHAPKQSKVNHNDRLNRAAWQSMVAFGYGINSDEEAMDPDELICFRLVRRKYQLGVLQLPQPAGLPRLHPKFLSRQSPPLRRQGGTSRTRQGNFAMGLSADAVTSRLNRLNQVLLIQHCKYKSLRAEKRSASSSMQVNLKRNIRNEQTMRFRSLSRDLQLPVLNCTHTTFDSPELLFQKLLRFIERENGVYIISEHDYSLFCKVMEPKETDLSITMGCIQKGFQLIGLVLQKIKGSSSTFAEFEEKLTEFLGF